MTDDLQACVRAIVHQPIAELVALGLHGGEQAAHRLLVRQFANQLDLADNLDGLKTLGEEIDDAIASITAEARERQ
jgi:hypothetical protein